MAIEITLADVRAVCPSLTATDANLQLLIDTVTCRLDSCLEAAYADCITQARTIKIYTICHFATMSERSGQLKSRKWDSGASESYGSYVDGGRGLNATQFGESLALLDTAGCVASVFVQQRQFIATAGTSGSRSTGYQFGDQ